MIVSSLVSACGDLSLKLAIVVMVGVLCFARIKRSPYCRGTDVSAELVSSGGTSIGELTHPCALSAWYFCK